jgi:hypothetical protein
MPQQAGRVSLATPVCFHCRCIVDAKKANSYFLSAFSFSTCAYFFCAQ